MTNDLLLEKEECFSVNHHNITFNYHNRKENELTSTCIIYEIKQLTSNYKKQILMLINLPNNNYKMEPCVLFQ